VRAQGYAVERLGDGVVQLPGEALPLFEGGLALRGGEQLGVLHRNRNLVGNGAQEDPLVLGGLSTGQVVEVDGAERLSARDKRHNIYSVPSGFADEGVNGSVERVVEKHSPDVVREGWPLRTEYANHAPMDPGPPGSLHGGCVALGQAMRASRVDHARLLVYEHYRAGDRLGALHGTGREGIQGSLYRPVYGQARGDAGQGSGALLEHLVGLLALGDFANNVADNLSSAVGDHARRGLDIYQRTVLATIPPLAQ
jgi:hypothetical protein